MAKCFIHSHSLKDNDGSKKAACLKIYRDQDEKELSINFDNSSGAFLQCRRISAVIFNSDWSNEVIGKEIYITGSIRKNVKW